MTDQVQPTDNMAENTEDLAKRKVSPSRRLENLSSSLLRNGKKLLGPKLDAAALRSARLWKSPIRGPWLTSLFGSMLLVGIPIMFITGIVSYIAYNPQLGNDNTSNHGILGFFFFNWLSNPSWIYRVSQGTHVTLGLLLTPILLAKLWSVIPKLFSFPPIKSIANALERLSLILLVGGGVFEFVTGIMNIEYYYVWRFSFYQAHYFGAWLFIAGFTTHAALKMPLMVRSLRSRSLRQELRTPLSATVSEPPGELVAIAPSKPTISRRGLLGLVLASSATVFVVTAGQTIRVLKPTALLAPRGRRLGKTPNDFEVNIPFVSSKIHPNEIGDSWRLQVKGPKGTLQFSRAELLAMPQTTAELPIACVEGWSTVQTWTGIPLVTLARAVGARPGSNLFVNSLERPGTPFRQTTLSDTQASNPNSLLALRVNHADLSPDHGFPARIIVPGAPGVHCTKWVQLLQFMEA